MENKKKVEFVLEQMPQKFVKEEKLQRMMMIIIIKLIFFSWSLSA